MSSVKESRPISQHRPLPSTAPVNVPARAAGGRSGHSHSLSLGVLNTSHRVRRKSTAAPGSRGLGLALVQGIDQASLEALVSDERMGASVKNGSVIRRADSGSTLKPGNSYSSAAFLGPPTGAGDRGDEKMGVDSALMDGPGLADGGSGAAKNRNRRASDGAFLSKSDAKRSSGELRCEKCGKGYKHSSCLTKHLWEHTPEWSLTSKLSISKHQQVQLLEAASVLVAMNLDPIAQSDAAKASDSDASVESPAFSGSSEIPDDDLSSVDTTPPPSNEHTGYLSDPKRYSSNSSVFSHSVPGDSIAASSVPTSSYASSYQQQGYLRRPSTSGTLYSGGLPHEEEAGLAEAVELCNFGTPRTGPTHAEDIPPVPPLPAQYASHKPNRSIGGTFYPLPELMASHLTHRISDERDVKVGYARAKRADMDDDIYERRSLSQGRSDDADEGVFGHMEE